MCDFLSHYNYEIFSSPVLADSPWRSKGERPPIAQKPASVPPPAPKLQSNHRSSPTTSPPLPRRQSTDHTPSPPPPPPKNEVAENSHEKVYGEYVMLEDAQIFDSLGKQQSVLTQ